MELFYRTGHIREFVDPLAVSVTLGQVVVKDVLEILLKDLQPIFTSLAVFLTAPGSDRHN